MSRTRKIREAQAILKALGLPEPQQNQISALTLLALCGVPANGSWSAARREPRTVTKGLMNFIESKYGIRYAPNTRETVRRQVLHQLVLAGVAEYNPFMPDLPTNSPRTHYAISHAALAAIRNFDAASWGDAVRRFVEGHGALIEVFERQRTGRAVPIKLPDGRSLNLSPGKHNKVQKAVIEEFAPRFAPGAWLLYLGDSSKKKLVIESERLKALGVSLTEHDKLPDVVLYDESRNWLYLVEAVTSHGPMSPKRVLELERALVGSRAESLYISAFPDMSEFRKHLRDIAWETEVWIAEIPDHLIHYNGDRFLGPRRRSQR